MTAHAPRVLVPCGNKLGESVLWHRATEQLIWLDLLEPAIFVHGLGDQTLRRALPLEAPLGALVATADPDMMMITHRRGIVTYRMSDGAMRPFANPEGERDAIAYNDGKVDRFGRLWVGTSHIDETDARGALWCVLPNGQAILGDAGFAVANGPAFSADGRTLYFNDTLSRKTLRYEISADDAYPRNRAVLVQYDSNEGYPDGITVDAEGCLWVAHWDGSRITRFSPEGERLQYFDLPVGNVTSLCFGGDRYERLFITTAIDSRKREPEAGHLFVLEQPGLRGLPEPLFRLPSAE
jgi:sugar lactone lactonase YvrE